MTTNQKTVAELKAELDRLEAEFEITSVAAPSPADIAADTIRELRLQQIRAMAHSKTNYPDDSAALAKLELTEWSSKMMRPNL